MQLRLPSVGLNSYHLIVVLSPDGDLPGHVFVESSAINGGTRVSY